MKYRITVEVLEPFPKMETVYKATDGKIYHSTYRIPDGEKYTESTQPTGETGYEKREVYGQEIELPSIENIIKAANSLQ